MFAECWTRKLATAYTIPGLPGHDSVSTYAWHAEHPILLNDDRTVVFH